MGWEVKIALSCQSKHGVEESSAKTRKFFTGGSQEQNRWSKIYNVVWRQSFRMHFCKNGKI